jgi:hypothetical protein
MLWTCGLGSLNRGDDPIVIVVIQMMLTIQKVQDKEPSQPCHVPPHFP